MTKFSVCVPNYNYGRYLGETLESVLSQSFEDFEICVSDNASNDDSVDVVKSFEDERVKLSVNPVNVGFAPNLDRAAAMATGRTMIMLSSDDLMLPGALETYARLLDSVGDDSYIVGSALRVIGASGTQLGRRAARPGIWELNDFDDSLSEEIGAAVYSAPMRTVLRRSVTTMRNPLSFATVAYPRDLYWHIGGYSGQRLVNPDKWFNWRLLAHGDRAYFVNSDLFAYRWHQENQTAQQKASGALKFLVDEYVASFQLDDAVLASIGINRDSVEASFVHNDIVLRGFRSLAKGERKEVRRSICLARAAYPGVCRRSVQLWALRGATAAGPAGTAIARLAERQAMSRWRSGDQEPGGLHETWAP